jgi:hypothetical protein
MRMYTPRSIVGLDTIGRPDTIGAVAITIGR